MEYKISELLDGMELPTVELEEESVSPERIRALTMGKLNRKTKKTHPKRAVFAVLAAALCAAVGIAAFADSAGFLQFDGHQSNENFFSYVFGKSVAGHEAFTRTYTVDGKEKTEYYPAFERENVDPEKAQELVGGHVTRIDQYAAVGDFTVTVFDLIADENGIGALTYGISNPGGINDIERDMAKPYVWLDLQTASGKKADVMDYRLEGGSDTDAEYVCYFAPFYPDENEDYLLTLHYRDGEELKAVPLEISVADRISASLFSDKNAAVAVSPLGMVMTTDAEEESVIEELMISFDSGEEYVVMDGEHYNASVEALNDEDGSIALAFNRLVDVDEIREITLTVNGQEYRLK